MENKSETCSIAVIHAQNHLLNSHTYCGLFLGKLKDLHYHFWTLGDTFDMYVGEYLPCPVCQFSKARCNSNFSAKTKLAEG